MDLVALLQKERAAVAKVADRFRYSTVEREQDLFAIADSRVSSLDRDIAEQSIMILSALGLDHAAELVRSALCKILTFRPIDAHHPETTTVPFLPGTKLRQPGGNHPPAQVRLNAGRETQA